MAIIASGLSPSFPHSIIVLAVGGMVDSVSVVVRSTLLQALTPEHLLGRVPSVVLGGIATLAVVMVTAVRVPELRRLREIR